MDMDSPSASAENTPSHPHGHTRSRLPQLQVILHLQNHIHPTANSLPPLVNSVHLQNQVQNELKFQRREELPEAAGTRSSRTRSSGTRSSDHDWNILKEVQDVNERLTSASPAPLSPTCPIRPGAGGNENEWWGSSFGVQGQCQENTMPAKFAQIFEENFGKV